MQIVDQQEAAIRERQRIAASYACTDCMSGELAVDAAPDSQLPQETAAASQKPAGTCATHITSRGQACVHSHSILASTSDSIMASNTGASTDSSAHSSAQSSPRTVVPVRLPCRAAKLPDVGEPLPSPHDMATSLEDLMHDHRTAALVAWGAPPADISSSGGAVNEDGCDYSLVPLAVAIEACVVRRALSQYACTSSACMR